MREFIEALFEKENKIEFQYEDYEMSFFAGIRQYSIDLYDIRLFPDVRHGHFCCSQHLLLMADGAADAAFCHQ